MKYECKSGGGDDCKSTSKGAGTCSFDNPTVSLFGYIQLKLTVHIAILN